MRPPCETIVQDLLLYLRREVAHQLVKNGFSQTDIAAKLSVSQPIVSGYLRDKERIFIYNKRFPSLEADIKALSIEISELIIQGEPPHEVITKICAFCLSLRHEGPVCTIHREILPTLSQVANPCTLCLPYEESFADTSAYTFLNKVQTHCQLILKEEHFIRLVPEIGAQMAVLYITESSTSPRVASFPGRIINVRNKPVSMSYPMFGISKTSSTILKTLSNIGSKRSYLLSIKQSKALVMRLKAKYQLIETKEGDRSWRDTLSSFNREKLAQIDIIADSGGVGFEPIIYLLATNFSDLLEMIRFILKE